MKCPYCGFEESRVVDSRSADDNDTIRRRRECISCGRRFLTYERIETIPLVVLKRDGRRETFDREKLLRGVIKATEKRPISMEQIEEAVDSIEKRALANMAREVPSTVLGDYVMQELRKLDKVAYIRFAAVYKGLEIGEMKKELDSLIEEK